MLLLTGQSLKVDLQDLNLALLNTGIKTKHGQVPLPITILMQQVIQTYAGNAGISSAEGWGLRWANILNYKTKLFNDNHQLNATLGQELSNSASEGYGISGSRYPFHLHRTCICHDGSISASTTIYYSLGSSAGAPGECFLTLAIELFIIR